MSNELKPCGCCDRLQAQVDTLMELVRTLSEARARALLYVPLDSCLYERISAEHEGAEKIKTLLFKCRELGLEV